MLVHTRNHDYCAFAIVTSAAKNLRAIPRSAFSVVDRRFEESRHYVLCFEIMNGQLIPPGRRKRGFLCYALPTCRARHSIGICFCFGAFGCRGYAATAVASISRLLFLWSGSYTFKRRVYESRVLRTWTRYRYSLHALSLRGPSDQRTIISLPATCANGAASAPQIDTDQTGNH